MTVQQRPSFLPWLFILVPLCVAVFFFGRGMLAPSQPWENASWEKTTGTVTGMSVVFSGPMFAGEQSGKRSSFEAKVTYQYDAAGRSFGGSDASFVLKRYASEIIGRPEAERRALELFPVGAKVAVFYNPRAPSESTLQPGFQNASSADFFVGGACLLVAGWQWLSLRKKRS